MFHLDVWSRRAALLPALTKSARLTERRDGTPHRWNNLKTLDLLSLILAAVFQRPHAVVALGFERLIWRSTAP
ncbi:hypothetical protein Thiosp_04033 [Thiorhodovibrio litoralis]|nr:hypothetical protein Thiosp_04033 [Thiorhodovibrio litoralis]